MEQQYILYVGALKSRKNFPRLLEAYAVLRRWKLVIVGARKWKFSPIFDSVQRLCLEPHVNFTGYVEDEHLSRSTLVRTSSSFAASTRDSACRY